MTGKYIPAVFDCETDPFKAFRFPVPFACGFYFEVNGVGHYRRTWGKDCITEAMAIIDSYPYNFRIYAHNGGKFDFHYLIPWLSEGSQIKIVHGRITSAKMGRHYLQDSYAIMPFPLSHYQKDKIDYKKFERHRREKHKEEILEYLRTDCLYLFGLVKRNLDLFGYRLTIGGTAMSLLQTLHPFKRLSPQWDGVFREFYFGGRVQCFDHGVLPSSPGKKWRIYDRNSMYPAVMRDKRHPINCEFNEGTKMPDDFERVFFMEWSGYSYGAVPFKEGKGKALQFPYGYGRFKSCSHEIEAGLRHGLIRIDKVHKVYRFRHWINFDDYVNTYYKMKQQGKEEKDKALELFGKYLLNSGYGKYAQTPENFADYYLSREDLDDEEELKKDGFRLKHHVPGSYALFARKTGIKDADGNLVYDSDGNPIPDPRHFYDVTIGASITSAARADLLDAIQGATRPIYCDTDSIICEGLDGVPFHESELGAWKLDGEAEIAVIGGKKMYAVYNRGDKEPVKLASKGGRLTLPQLIKLAQGGTVDHVNEVPTYGLHRDQHPIKSFQRRTMKKTVHDTTRPANILAAE